ncbi:hypothetical protein CAPGI0001_1963 [Capnocytophaga gingivalis ATCC 33624]|nr:hypothetical protein CAPGI0001_1963 [Capnocytophaga gingivalis ATCC 33624]
MLQKKVVPLWDTKSQQVDYFLTDYFIIKNFIYEYKKSFRRKIRD